MSQKTGQRTMVPPLSLGPWGVPGVEIRSVLQHRADAGRRRFADRGDHAAQLPRPVRGGRRARVRHALVVEDNRTGLRRTIDARALFVFIGANPCTDWLGDEVALDQDGFVQTGPEATPAGDPADAGWQPFVLETSRRGVFAAGDVRSGSIKRVASAVGEGAMAVHLVHERIGTAAPGGGLAAPV